MVALKVEMKKTLQIVTQNKYTFLYLVFFAAIMVFLASLVNRSIHNDDAWLGEQAYWLTKAGYVKSELLRGLNGYEDQQFVYHKLFIWIGALAITVFGFNLFVLKSVSLVFLIVFFFIFRNFIQKILKLEKGIILVMLILIIVNPLIFNYGFIYRPEIMLMTLGFCSFIYLYLANKDFNGKHALLAGVFAGLSFLTHLNGISIAVTGFIILLIFKQYRLCVLYSVSAFLVSCFYYIDLNTVAAFNKFIYQFHNDPAITDNDYSGIMEYVGNLLSEHKRFLRGPKTLLFSLIVILLLIIGHKGLKKHSFLKIYIVLLIVIFATLAQSKTNRYMLIYMPYLLLIIGLCMQNVSNERSKKYIYSVVIVFFIYCVFNVGLNISTFSDNFNAIRDHKEISIKHGLENEKMVGPMAFIFQQINHQQIHSVRLYLFLKERDKSIDDGSCHFFETAESFGNKSIIMIPVSYDLLNIPVPTQDQIGKTFGNFELMEIKDERYFIYKLLK